MQHAHQQQPFGLGGQMNGVQGGSSMPNPGAHNFQFNQFNKANLGALQLQQALAARNGNQSMLQMTAQQPELARQLSLMGYQQPNQTPNAPNLNALRQLQQQHHQQQQQHQLHPGMGAQLGPNLGQSGFFPNANANMIHSEGVQVLLHNNMPPQQPSMQAGASMNQGHGGPVPLHALREKVQQMQAQCKELQAREQYLINNRLGKSEVQFQQELGIVRKGLEDRRGQLQKLVAMLQAMTAQSNRQVGQM